MIGEKLTSPFVWRGSNERSEEGMRYHFLFYIRNKNPESSVHQKGSYRRKSDRNCKRACGFWKGWSFTNRYSFFVFVLLSVPWYFTSFTAPFLLKVSGRLTNFGRNFKSQNNLFVNGVFHCMMGDSPSSSEGCTGILPLLGLPILPTVSLSNWWECWNRRIEIHGYPTFAAFQYLLQTIVVVRWWFHFFWFYCSPVLGEIIRFDW